MRSEIYKKNLRFVKALRLPHKPILDDKTKALGNTDNFCEDSVRTKFGDKVGYRPFNLHKRSDILLMYALAYQIDIASDDDGVPTATVKYGDNREPDVFTCKGKMHYTDVNEMLLDAIISYAEHKQFETPQIFEMNHYINLFH
ncbi:hypothetical protein [Vibrio sp. D431a]|uniref:hypothetical protein n=1 Tax=Vibrio sp. D431a TaxID=2837388 RepID=UPI002555D9DC|nr:hypothetical protein [Vibrio sp. D431a]MDK9793321.1 hypothetical protein [Vibrio sp. D431a]